jgi:hypothetical protein
MYSISLQKYELSKTLIFQNYKKKIIIKYQNEKKSNNLAQKGTIINIDEP